MSDLLTQLTHATVTPQPFDTELLFWKVVAGIVLFFASAAGGFLPVLLRAHRYLISVLTVFAGGVILSAGFVHLLSDAVNALDEHEHDHHEHTPHPPHDHHALTSNAMLKSSFTHGDHGHGAFPWAMLFAGIGFLIPMFLDGICGAIASIWIKPAPKSSAVNTYSDVSANAVYPADTADTGSSAARLRQLLPSILFLIALTVHAILEAMSIGMQRDTSSELTIAGAILCHKALEAMALGSATFEGVGRRVTPYYVIVVIGFSLLTPVGIGLGILLTDNLDESGLGILFALAAGTFIYVGAVEVLAKELGEGSGHGGGHTHGIPLVNTNANQYGAVEGMHEHTEEVEDTPCMGAVKTITKVVACAVGFGAMSALSLVA